VIFSRIQHLIYCIFEKSQASFPNFFIFFVCQLDFPHAKNYNNDEKSNL